MHTFVHMSMLKAGFSGIKGARTEDASPSRNSCFVTAVEAELRERLQRWRKRQGIQEAGRQSKWRAESKGMKSATVTKKPSVKNGLSNVDLQRPNDLPLEVILPLYILLSAWVLKKKKESKCLCRGST